MLKQAHALDRAFYGLSDATRRALLDRLVGGPASVSELAKPFSVSFASIVQHIQVLEACGLIVTAKVGRTRTCQISTETIARVEQWLSERRLQWETRFDRLGSILEGIEDRPPTGKTIKPKNLRRSIP